MYTGPNIITDGLVLYLDAANQKSYTSGSTTARSLIGTVTGSLVNGVGFSTGSNGSWVFDGSNDRIDIELPTPIKINNVATSSLDYQWTIQFYFTTNAIYDGNVNPPISDRHTIFSFLNTNFSGNGYRYWSFEIWGNSVYVTFNGDGTNFTQGSVSQTINNTYNIINSNTFRFITAIIQGNNIKIYQNNLIELFNRNSTYSMQSKYLSLGTRNDNLLNGNISMFSLYNKVLSAAEILQNYNATKSKFNL